MKMHEYWCDCWESTDAIGLFVSTSQRPNEPSYFTPVGKEVCPYCGHYSVLSDQNLLDNVRGVYENKRFIKKNREKFVKAFNEIYARYSNFKPVVKRGVYNATNEEGQRKALGSGWGDERFDILWG